LSAGALAAGLAAAGALAAGAFFSAALAGISVHVCVGEFQNACVSAGRTEH
jgi:hypothetical protein